MCSIFLQGKFICFSIRKRAPFDHILNKCRYFYIIIFINNLWSSCLQTARNLILCSQLQKFRVVFHLSNDFDQRIWWIHQNVLRTVVLFASNISDSFIPPTTPKFMVDQKRTNLGKWIWTCGIIQTFETVMVTYIIYIYGIYNICHIFLV